MAESPAAAFDGVAASYDATFGANPVGRLFRYVFQERLRRHLRPGMRVIDLGCGTGEDAAFVAGLGADVVGIDASSGMIERACGREVPHGIGSLTFEPRRAEDVGALSGSFDAAYSDFGALNAADLTQVGGGLAKVLRGGAPVLFSFMGAHPLPMTLARAVTGRGERRGARTPLVAGVPVPVAYPSIRDVREQLGEAFVWDGAFALGVLVPDPDREAWVNAHPQAFGVLAALEAGVRSWPVLRGLGDHVVHEGRRR